MEHKAKILFIMQQVSPGTHMDYVFEMARTLREERGLQLELLLEKSSSARVAQPWVREQRWRWPLFRVLENFWLVLKARLRGAKVFYVHYSFLSAITAGLVTRLFGGQVYYWNAGMPWLYKRSWREEWYQRLAYRLIHVLVTGAEALREGYCATYHLRPEQVRVIPNWIDLTTILPDTKQRLLTRQGLGLGETDILVLFVHKLSQRKGADLLVPIMEQVADPRVHLVVAGDGPLRQAIEADSVAKGQGKQIYFLGFVDRPTVQSLYGAADMFVMPSEEEGSPHSLIEALAYGVPPVVTDVGGVRETMTQSLSELIVTYPDVAALAAKVRELSHDAEKRTAIGSVCRAVAKTYDKPVIVDRFYELFTTY